MTGHAYAELKRLTAEAARNGWSAFGIDRDDTPTQSALIEEAIRLLAARLTGKPPAEAPRVERRHPGPPSDKAAEAARAVKEEGITQTEAARRSGITRQAVSQYLRNEKKKAAR